MVSPINIQKAWAATGLSPFELEIVIKQFPLPEDYQWYNVTIRPTMPPEGTLIFSRPGGDDKVLLNPANTLQIQQYFGMQLREKISKSYSKK